MKSVFTLRVLWLLLPVLSAFSVFSQPDYVFKNPVHESGTALQPGAVYKFPDVKGGTDARVTVMSFTGGVTLDAIDETWTGFDEAFQPFINVAPGADGYVEFRVDFYQKNTMNLKQQGMVPVTCIDVDGVTYSDGVLYEHDRVQFLPGFYDWQMTGGNLNVSVNAFWVGIKNISGFSYSGVDTAAKDVMSTVVNRNTTGFLLRIGAVNTSPTVSEVRYRSVYFKRFNYGHPEPLALSSILNLSGSKKQNGVELKIQLSSDHGFNKTVVERSASSASSFYAIGEMNIAAGHGVASSLSYFDNQAGNQTNYYRVRLINTQSGKEELSNILMIKGDKENNNAEIITSLLQPANPVLAIRSTEDGEANLQVFDMSGRSVAKAKVRLNTGSNSISLPAFNAGKGYFVVNLETKNNQVISRKVMVQ